jgi:ABC-type sugar transport system permease subunit
MTTETLNIYAFKQLLRFYDIGYAAALAVVLLIITLASGTIISRYIPFGE